MSESATKTISAIASPHELPDARRLVVKVGSSSLTTVSGGISHERLKFLVDTLAETVNNGTEVILVSSGAIAAGLAPLGLPKRPKDLATQQAAAAVGQGLLLAQYTQLFEEHDLRVGQVLLTADDLMRRSSYTNALRSLVRLLNLGVLPIVNENDAVATREIRFGDNDRLASLVAHLVKADALLLFSDVDSVYDAHPEEGGSRITTIEHPDELEAVDLGTPGAAGVGTGGMITKVDAATMSSSAGIPTLVTSTDNAAKALRGEDVGTWFAARNSRRSARDVWLAYLASIEGRLILDEGAVQAISRGTNSLLAAGIIDVEGAFEPGDAVEICGSDRVPFARGLVNYSSEELPEMLGQNTGDLVEQLGEGYDKSVVHVDDLALIEPIF
ncbi:MULTISPECIES: glutamate 5-kinase [Glutamicibacter]|uniref:Glutamate 5-kinase n=1 Tax=Glutamicibacter halophytocola TaxID=1933880 RepID=A0A5B8HZG0_9MICC|nr:MULTISPECIES: glutamate 5-kinase [Glutamicibacter]ALG29179.1 gamma-glutamyl kinase [Glutamicibacter halophytocola]MBF6673640.1 glutamate 5-kinase [Glutamicibacter sp. FBE19]NQD40968.1 glutamate 5-kinase [Glutamicibacter halophytocola]QDY65439.1 glutamate 5-kinase [Glutamicibacter halophytocola]UUX57535.1 glutamate 5-kinase [Glutamicibacter halophytocola]